MSKRVLGALLSLAVVWLSGCVVAPVESFTMEVDLPADFSFKGDAVYSLVADDACQLHRRNGNRPEHKFFRSLAKSMANRVSFELPLTKQVGGCPLVLRSITFAIGSHWGERWWDIGRDYAAIDVVDGWEFDTRETPKNGVQEWHGRCQWFFRTTGREHAIGKLLRCNSLSSSGHVTKARVGGHVSRSDLPGKTLRLVLTTTDEELPAVDDNWVRVEGGWKRCMGESLEDTLAFCHGDFSKFKAFKMPDGRHCNIYPTCE